MSSRSDFLAYLDAEGYTPNRAVLFEEGSGSPVEFYTTASLTVFGFDAAWTTVDGHAALRFPDSTDFLTLGASNGFLDTTKQTVLLIRAKHDTTARGSAAFGLDSSTNRCGAHLPWSDGTVYWDFGGTSSPNRLTYGGYTRTTDIEAWAFRAGTLGSAIWKDGAQVATQATLITRGSEATDFRISSGMSVGSDLVDWLFFALIPDEVSDAVLANFTAAIVLDSASGGGGPLVRPSLLNSALLRGGRLI